MNRGSVTSGWCQPRKEAGAQCFEEWECKDGYSCYEGSCVKRCQDDMDCAVGQACSLIQNGFGLCGPPVGNRSVAQKANMPTIAIVLLGGIIALVALLMLYKFIRRKPVQDAALSPAWSTFATPQPPEEPPKYWDLFPGQSSHAGESPSRH